MLSIWNGKLFLGPCYAIKTYRNNEKQLICEEKWSQGITECIMVFVCLFVYF